MSLGSMWLIDYTQYLTTLVNRKRCDSCHTETQRFWVIIIIIIIIIIIFLQSEILIRETEESASHVSLILNLH
jgi:hypothetical protein